MPFKDISYLELWQRFCSAERKDLCYFGRGYYEEHFCEIILNLDQWLWRKCHLKDISYLEVWQPFCSAEQNLLCNFGRGCYEEQFFLNYFEFGPVAQERCCLKDFLSGALASLLFNGAEPFMHF